jgi:hypothetical protein
MNRKHVGAAVAVTLVVVLVWVVGLPSEALAQGLASTSTLTGQVTDQSGAVVPGVQLSLLNVGGGEPINTVSNQAGYYQFSYLRPATYVLTAKLKGFGDVSIPNINLEVNQTSSINITMKPGAVLQEITVSGAAAALETQTSSAGGVVGQQIEQQLPVILRDPTSLINLVPGVTSDHRTVTQTTTNATSYNLRLDFEINGGYREQAVSMVDGVDVTVPAGSMDAIPIVATPDITQEFKVQTNNLGPEFGRGLAVLNIVTRSGTNSIHGALFEFVQNNVFNSQDLFSNAAGLPKAAAKRNQFGGAAGGPVYIPHLYDGRNKTFWFFNVETMRQRRASPVAVQVPSAAERTGDFSADYALNGTPLTIYNPNAPFQDVNGVWTRPVIAGNKIPQSMWLDPTYVKNVLSYFPLPDTPGLLGPQGQYTGINNYQVVGSGPLTWSRYDVKIDQNVGSSQRIMARWSHSLYHSLPLDIFHNAASSGIYGTNDDAQPGYNGVISWTWTASPTTVVTSAISLSHIVDDNTTPLFNPTSLGGPFANGAIENFLNQWTGGGAFPNLTFSDYATTGNGFGTAYNEPFANYGISAGVTHTHGRHTLKVGFQGELLVGADMLSKGFGTSVNYSGTWTDGPSIFTPSPNTGIGGADFLLGLDSSDTIDAGFSSYYSDKYFAVYVADDFRVTPKLTLNLGVRYEVSTPFMERHDHEFRFDPNALNPIGGSIGPNTGGQTINDLLVGLGNRQLQGVVEFPSSPGVSGRGMVPTDWTNFAPRLGLAYQITPKLVFRAGFGKIYGLSPVLPGPSTPSDGTFGAATNAIVSVDGIHPYTNTDNPFPSGFNIPTYDKLGFESLLGTAVVAGATNNVTPYQWQFNAGFQYELPGNTLLGINYAGGRGHRLTCAFFFCGDQIPQDQVQQYGSSVFNSVPNPFYGIITNPTAALSAPTVQLGQLLKQWPAYTQWQAVLPPWQGPAPNHDTFQSQFDALEVQLNKRFSHGLTLMVAYTYDKLLTNTDSFEAGYLGPAFGYQNNVNYNGEWSLSAADVPQRLVIGHVYDLPFGKGLRFGSNMPSVLDKVVGHWQFSGMTTFQAGYPLPVSEAGHTNGAFSSANTVDRPSMVSGQDPCGDLGRSRGQKILQYMNPNAFYVPANFTFGNAPRILNGCRDDGQKNFDLALLKFIPIKEKLKTEIRAEFYNAFNRPQLANPSTTFNSPGFGAIGSQANAPRIIQIGIKLDF